MSTVLQAQGRIEAGKASERRPVVAGVHIVQPRFDIPFLAGELLIDAVISSKQIRAPGLAGGDLLAEGQKVMPPHHAGVRIGDHAHAAQVIRGQVTRPARHRGATLAYSAAACPKASDTYQVVPLGPAFSTRWPLPSRHSSRCPRPWRPVPGPLPAGLALKDSSIKEVAGRLAVSESVVKNTLQQLFPKTEVRTCGQLVRVALERYRSLL